MTIPRDLYKPALFLLCLCFSLLWGCDTPETPAPASPLDDILNAGEVIMITRNNANCYYQYRDRFAGFEYDLARAFADYLGVTLKVRVADKWDQMSALLREAPGALIAANTVITAERQKQVAFSEPYTEISLCIITHRENRNIRKIGDISGHRVHFRNESPYRQWLRTLKKQGIVPDAVPHDDLDTEELIAQVAEKKIGIALADSNSVRLNRQYYPQTVTLSATVPRARLAWGVHPRGHKLRKQISTFFKSVKQSGKFSAIWDRYYAASPELGHVDVDAFHRRIKTRLPRYLPFIRDAAGEYGFDWRLIAAQAYQESHLNPQARSKNGAYGLMQITSAAGRAQNATDLTDPRQNIHTGVRHLREMYDFFDRADADERMKIALAAYNVGQGHILDARILARSMNLNPDKWSSLARTLPLLSRKKYYSEALYGYCRGTEPTEYVRRVTAYYNILKHRSRRHKTEEARPALQDSPATDQ
ncbi:membrane-bound lytic murein transglycosylase MltF [Desulfonema ishimotonii]|nr:membrane-bound lytic murein transglycosylase MltF [Desulfonema ishimotonii]